MLIQLDDKNGITFGNPGEPQAVMAHSRSGRGSAIGLAGAPTRAMDHACGARSKVTPSVSMIMEPPFDVRDCWYQGDVYVCLVSVAWTFFSSVILAHTRSVNHRRTPSLSRRRQSGMRRSSCRS